VSANQDLEKLCGKGLLKPSATRWGYAIKVVERFLEIEKSVKRVCEKKGWPFLEPEVVQFMRDLMPIVSPFTEILFECQSDKAISISGD
jgi:hypothetical protein